MRLKVGKGDIWILIYFYLSFQTLLQSVSSGWINKVIQYSDDFVVLGLLCVLFIRIINRRVRIKKEELVLLISFVLFELIGLLCGLFYEYCSLTGVLIDAFTCAKFIIVFIAAWKLSENAVSDCLVLKINKICQIMAFILFVLTLHELFLQPFWEKAEYRYFTYSIKLFFTHPEGLARACFSFVLPLAYNMRYHKKNMPYIMMLCFTMAFTFRSKAIAAMLVILMLYFYRKYLKGKHIMVFLAMLAVIVLLVGIDQVNYYYSHALISRTKLLTDSIQLANKFPLGVGFGAFGSNVALDYHSALYEEMGYFNPDNPWAVRAFLNDAFWPIIIAQTGWIGTFLFCITTIELTKIGITLYKKDFFVSWIILSVVMYDLISTPASSAFFHPLALSSYLFLGLIFSIRKDLLNESSLYFSSGKPRS